MTTEIGTDIELLPAQLLNPTLDAMSKAIMLRDIHDAVGTKTEPTVLEVGFNCHPDSCGVEFTTPPAGSAAEFADAIEHGIGLVSEYFGMEFVCANRYDIAPVLDALMAVAPDVAKTILARGCDPDWWVPAPGEMGVLRPRPEDTHTMMELGGHLHIDVPKVMRYYLESVVSMLSCVLDEHHTPYEHSWYRIPGVYRPKPYGLEYRSLGAEWAASHSKRLAIFTAVNHGMESFND